MVDLTVLRFVVALGGWHEQTTGLSIAWWNNRHMNERTVGWL